jgi:long-chain acyl-CoA synthetase
MSMAKPCWAETPSLQSANCCELGLLYNAVLQAGDIRTSLGSGLLQLGITPKSMLGLYSVNCKEWVLLDAAAHAYSMTSVPLYDTLGPDAVEFICNHAELAAVGCSAAVLPTLMSCLHKCPSVKLLVSPGSGWGDFGGGARGVC